jgi:hypothetical protein
MNQSFVNINSPLAGSNNSQPENLPTICNNTSSRRQLPDNFEPLPDTVIIGKGGLPRQATGNRRLRDIVKTQLNNYASAKSKGEKACIVSNIHQSIEESCAEGHAFVKFDSQGWWEASEKNIRAKIMSTFRDSLSGMYKSSTKSKVAKRRAHKAASTTTTTTTTTQKAFWLVEPTPIAYEINPDAMSFPKRVHYRASFLMFTSDAILREPLLEPFDEMIFDLPTGTSPDDGDDAAVVSSSEVESSIPNHRFDDTSNNSWSYGRQSIDLESSEELNAIMVTLEHFDNDHDILSM